MIRTLMTTRDEAWYRVWNCRDAERTDWNGYEACFLDFAAYERWSDSVAKEIVSKLAIGPSDRVADLGCGTGRIAGIVARYAGSLMGVDYSDAALAVANRRHSAGNIEFVRKDLNVLSPSDLRGVTKAYAVGSFFYLTSTGRVFSLVQQLRDAEIALYIGDLPDRNRLDTRPRDGDRTVTTHLDFDENEMCQVFPGSQIIRRGSDSGYVNDDKRFSIIIHQETS